MMRIVNITSRSPCGSQTNAKGRAVERREKTGSSTFPSRLDWPRIGPSGRGRPGAPLIGGINSGGRLPRASLLLHPVSGDAAAGWDGHQERHRVRQRRIRWGHLSASSKPGHAALLFCRSRHWRAETAISRPWLVHRWLQCEDMFRIE